jgi:CRISPR-associated endonuclease Csn1
MGVRIFPDGRDPQSGASLATDRRIARSARRNRDRHLRRKEELMAGLVAAGLMPEGKSDRKNLEKLDPYGLRKRGLDHPLSLHELGRAIFHLHQRRGFKSNRKTDKVADEDSGLIRQAVESMEKEIAGSGARTIGEYLAIRHDRREGVRARLVGTRKSDKRYVLYSERRMVKAEFDVLWVAQTKYHPELTNELREKLRAIIFRQRPLRPVQPGKCALDPATGQDDEGGFRTPWALPKAQRFRVIKEVNNLQLVLPDRSRRPLTLQERDKIVAALLANKKRTFDQLRRLLGLDPDVRFNLESERRGHLDGDQTAAVLSGKKIMGKNWHALSADIQNAVVEKALGEENRVHLVDWLRETLSIEPEVAERMADARLPEGVCRYGRRALGAILPIMEDQGLDEFNAALEAGYEPFAVAADGNRLKLPYYGEALPDAVTGTGDPSGRLEQRIGRIPKGKEQVEAHARRIEKKLPKWGKVNILTFTDRQYEKIISFRCKAKDSPGKNPDQLQLF